MRLRILTGTLAVLALLGCGVLMVLRIPRQTFPAR